MLHITNLTDGLDVFKALGSEVRIRIMNILLENNEMNMKELAHRLAISNGALTSHIRLLEECGLIHIANQQGIHGPPSRSVITATVTFIQPAAWPLKSI